MGGFFIVFMPSQTEQQVKRVFSGDQSLFSSWDSILKLYGLKRQYPDLAVEHQFHLSDNLGKRNDGGTGPALTAEVYRYEGGREIQPAWFAITEQWPAFPVLSTVPYRIGGFIGERFDSFANSTAQAFADLSNEVRKSLTEAMKSLAPTAKLPETTGDVYALLTSSTSFGIADEGRRSGASYNFSEIEKLQAQSMLQLYGQTARMAAPENRNGVKTRFKEITAPGGVYYSLVKEKSFPNAAANLYSHLDSEVGRISEVEGNGVELSDTITYFELVSSDGEISEKPEPFVFLDWYLKNRELYATAHNEVSEELSQKGENPIQSIADQKGETPFWVIIDGQKYKMFLEDKSLKIVRRDENTTVEHVALLEEPISTRVQLGNVLATEFAGQRITVIPTAIGLSLNFRASGDLLLPEHGSSYMPQADKVYQRMQLLATKAQYEDLIGQNDILRVHPHAISAMPDGVRLKLPWHLRDAFPTDAQGYTTTENIKALWQKVCVQRRQVLEQVKQASSITEKARLLFADAGISFAFDLADRLDDVTKAESSIKTRATSVMDEIKADTDPKKRKQLGQVSSYMRGQSEELPDSETLTVQRREEIEALRVGFQAFSETTGTRLADERVLKFLVAVRARQLDASIESLEYFDSRPSLLTIYLLFDEGGIRNVVNNTEVYRQETPKIEKAWFDAEGNKIVVIYDPSGDNIPTNRKVAQKIAKVMGKDGFDTTMVLTPTQNQDADFRVDQVCLDGSVGGMCGNGVRAVAMYMKETTGSNFTRLVTETGELVTGFSSQDEFGALLQTTSLDSNNRDRFKGIVPDELLEDEKFIATLPRRLQRQLYNQAGSEVRDSHVRAGSNVFDFTSISGEPHLVIGLPGFVLDEIGDYSGYLGYIAGKMNGMKADNGKPVFPNEVNVSFVTVSDQGEYRIATHERGGPGLTGACATGAVSIMSILRSIGHREVNFQTPSGRLRVEYSKGTYSVKGNVKKV